MNSAGLSPTIARSLAAVAVAVAATLIAAQAPSPAGTAGSAGTDTALPPTESAVRVKGRPCPGSADGCGFQNLDIKVSQTRNLLHQAVSVTWSGAATTNYVSGDVYGNFLQIFQCWGDDDGTHAENPGPPPEQCEFGGYQSNPKAASSLNFGASQFVASRVVSSDGSSTYDAPTPTDGYLDRAQGLIWKPFHAVDGTVVNASANFSANNPFAVGAGAYWRNGYFNYYTTNESPFARTYPDGTGSELFTLDTGLEAPGLGCGQKVERLPDGPPRIPRCWLVIVPRGTAAQENPPEIRTSAYPVTPSPLAASAWRNRISVPLDFLPVDSPCPIGADERRAAGSELAVAAVTSWQPRLCAVPGSPPYSYTALSDDLVRQQLVAGVSGVAGMGVMSSPIDPGRLDPEDPVIYAPLTLSGVVIGFNIERVPLVDPTDSTRLANPDEAPLAGVRVARANLTPRLVAKLLTQSYQAQFGGFSPPYPWYRSNPNNLIADPDFVRFNPEFADLKGGSVGAGRLVLEQPTSDAAYELWRWVLADPEAVAWMTGQADEWGMTVNPVYNASPARNPSGTGFGDPVPHGFPKSEPYCYQSNSALVDAGGLHPRPLCQLDIAPYVNSFEGAAQAVRTANDGARATENSAATSPDTAWVPTGPQPSGFRAMLSVTDSASAARFGLQTARLSRAGDDGADRAFVAADGAGLLAGQESMVASKVDGVVEPKPTAAVPGAYPLTMLTYAAVAPGSLDQKARDDYADFLIFATGDGQRQGLDQGQLPPGYAPLPPELRARAATAAERIRAGLPTAVEAGDVATPTGGDQGTAAAGTVPATTTATPASAGPAAVAATHSESSADRPGTSIATARSPSQASVHVPARPDAAVPATAAPKRGKTPGLAVGTLRFALPIAAGIALSGVLGVLVIDDRWQRSLLGRLRSRRTTNPAGA